MYIGEEIGEANGINIQQQHRPASKSQGIYCS